MRSLTEYPESAHGPGAIWASADNAEETRSLATTQNGPDTVTASTHVTSSDNRSDDARSVAIFSKRNTIWKRKEKNK